MDVKGIFRVGGYGEGAVGHFDPSTSSGESRLNDRRQIPRWDAVVAILRACGTLTPTLSQRERETHRLRQH
jgi:hypothetical protein